MTAKQLSLQYNQQMKKLSFMSVEETIQKRRQSKTSRQGREIYKKTKGSEVAQIIRQIDDMCIDRIIRSAMNKQQISQQQKIDAISIIAKKCGIKLNKNIILPYLEILYFPKIVQLDKNWTKNNKNMFILSGTLGIYEQLKKIKDKHIKFNTQPLNYKQIKNIYDEEDQEIINGTYDNFDEFWKSNFDYELIDQLKEFRSIGPVFHPEIKTDNQKDEKKMKLVATNAVVIEIKGIDLELYSIYNDGISNDQKAILLQKFPVLTLLSKKIQNYISSFKLKNYKLKQIVYNKNDIPHSVYFVVKGQVGFQYQVQPKLLNLPSSLQSKNGSKPLILNTGTMGPDGYFGQEQIINKSKRIQSAHCVSEKCVILELEKDRFQSMIEQSEILDAFKKTAKIKQNERKFQIEKSIFVMQSFAEKYKNKPVLLEQFQIEQLTKPHKLDENKKSIKSRRESQHNVKIMHGNIIKNFPQNKTEDLIQFSMLKVNPDMYDSAMKKYKKFNMKPPTKYQPNFKWNFKRVWKILNLEDVLREEQNQVSSPEGRKYYDCHRRYMSQLNETKSLRPKTSSTNYRTKLQYIAYLQQFNN